MKKIKKILILLLCLMLSIIGFTACGSDSESSSGEEQILIKYANTDSEERSHTQAAYWFADYMDKETDGKVKVEVYPNGQLGDDTELMKAISMNTVQLYNGSGNMSVVAGDKINVMQLPFVYDSYDDWHTGMLEKGGIDIAREAIDGSGIVLLDVEYEGARNVISTKKTYESIKDFSGFKIRVTPTDLNLKVWEAFGANPTPISYGEVYTALTQGTIDGVDHGIGVFLDAKFYEAAKYITMTNHVYGTADVITSQTFLDSLPEDIKPIFLEGVKQMAEKQRNEEHENEADFIKQLEDAGCTVVEISDDFKEDMKDATKSVYDFQREISGADMVDRFLATGGN